MKTVLLIDGSQIFHDFLEVKLSSESVALKYAAMREAYTKIVAILPDLIIIDIESDVDDEFLRFLEKLKRDPNAKRIPVIVTGYETDRNSVASLVDYGVRKYFSKPIRFDVFFDYVGRVLGMDFSMDTTPCILDLHVNGSIIFVEIAQGLNREKLLMLEFRMLEIIEKYSISNPKAVLMLSDVHLSFVDCSNVEILLDNISAGRRILYKNIKILTRDEFLKEFVKGHSEYLGVQVVENLQLVMNNLLDQGGPVYDERDYFVDRVLTSDKRDTESGSIGFIDHRNFITKPSSGSKNLKVAIVDDDIVIRKLLENSFSAVGASTTLFATGSAFVKSVVARDEYSLVVLDLFLPDIDGLAILETLQRRQYSVPVLVYSRAAEKSAVTESFRRGAVSYLVKPQKPQVIVRKALEILNSTD